MRPHSFFPPWAIFIQFTACLAATYEWCSSPNFNCAGINMSYPFGILNQGCGLPGFQLACDGNPRLHVDGNDYMILNASFISQGRITIVNEKLFERCRLDLHVYEDLNNSPFLVSHQNSNITELRDCGKKIPNQIVKLDCNRSGENYQWYLGFDEEGSASCSEVYTVPVLETKTVPKNSSQFIHLLRRGFQVEWKDPKITFPDCGRCEATKGMCGYYPSTGTFCCYCPGGEAQPYDCSDGLVIHSAYQHQKKKFIGGSAIIGAGIGISTLLVVALLLVIAYRKKMSFSRQVLRRKRDSPRSISKVEIFLHNYVDQMPTRYSYSDLKKITNNFAHKLGEGGFGVVYKGKLPSGNLVAVKMLDQSRDSETQFMNEVATIGRIHHIHLVRLLGFCFEGLRSALILYEYMANGSLDKFILARKEEDQILNWDQLYSIALGAAQGIAYLHDECHSRIIHFDRKPHNILLDEEFTAKVADFGLAKLCGRRDDHVSMTAARGTPGYVAPEVWSRNFGPVTDKSDVYGFGMMLLEIVGGRKNIDIQVIRSSQFYFPDWAIKLVERGELRTRLRERELSEADEAKARSMTKVGVWCIQYNSTDRPSMMRVLQMLEGDVDDIPNPPTPFNGRPQPAPFPVSEESSSIGIETAS